MNPEELPLQDLFNRLRDHGLPLGVEEYTAALQALRAGFGMEDRRALGQMCCTLWAKSDEETRLFHHLFDQMLHQPVTPREEEPLVPEPPESPPDEIPLETPRPELPEPVSPSTAPTPPPSFRLEQEDEPVQVVRAIRRSGRDDWPMTRPRFSLLTDYFPVTRRQMKQSWRHLRRPVREGPPEELDVRATVEKVGREGMLLEPVLIPRRSNRAELVLLIDQDGSMVPFHTLSRQLIETVRRGGRLKQTRVYYFHDYPDDYLYRDSARQEAHPISGVLATIGERTAVLIVSDAGAARGNLDLERIERTQSFVEQLKQSVRRYVWLNPMPNHRWADTTAGEIARVTPMFELSRSGLDEAISALRGQYIYWEKMYQWMI